MGSDETNTRWSEEEELGGGWWMVAVGGGERAEPPPGEGEEEEESRARVRFFWVFHVFEKKKKGKREKGDLVFFVYTNLLDGFILLQLPVHDGVSILEDLQLPRTQQGVDRICPLSHGNVSYDFRQLCVRNAIRVEPALLKNGGLRHIPHLLVVTRLGTFSAGRGRKKKKKKTLKTSLANTPRGKRLAYRFAMSL